MLLARPEEQQARRTQSFALNVVRLITILFDGDGFSTRVASGNFWASDAVSLVVSLGIFLGGFN